MSNGDYAEMIEFPVSTYEMVVLPKKRKKKNVKKRVVEKVNKSVDGAGDSFSIDNNVAVEKPEKKKFSFDIITAQVVAIFVLVIAIMVTNIFWEDSGINNLIKGAFSQTQVEIEVDNRVYNEFSPISPSKVSEIELSQGVMKIGSEGAIYSPCEGRVEDISEIDGKYTIAISHSDLFKTIIRGADYAYFEVGEAVYQSVPVCFSQGGAEVLMYNDNTLITAYSIVDGSIVWQS